MDVYEAGQSARFSIENWHWLGESGASKEGVVVRPARAAGANVQARQGGKAVPCRGFRRHLPAQNRSPAWQMDGDMGLRETTLRGGVRGKVGSDRRMREPAKFVRSGEFAFRSQRPGHPAPLRSRCIAQAD